jgi:hypothetical protein
MWAAAAAKAGYKWHVGNGRRVLFWEDKVGHLFSHCLFWDLYVIVNEQNCIVAEAWDGTDLKFTFRRSVSPVLFDRWLELVALVQTVHLSDSEDSPIGCFILLGCTLFLPSMG